MSNLAKIIIGVGAVGAIVATTYAVTKKTETKEEDDIPEGEEKEEKAEPKDFIAMAKDSMMKKATQMMAWIILHKEQIEAVGTALGIFASLMSVVNAVKEYTLGKKLHESLDEILEFQDDFRDHWNNKVTNDKDRYSKILEHIGHVEHMIQEL